MNKPELLSPVADFTMLEAAIEGGCNAVYFGVKTLNMRAAAKNFELSELKKVVERCHSTNVRAFLTVNTIVYEDELDKVKQVLKYAKDAKIDAIIAWDLAVVSLALEMKLETHLSTQASVSNSTAADHYEKWGIKRVILARECTLNQVKDIVTNSKVEVEMFIHGARCISVSGRCYISQDLFNKSANRGACIQPCRRQYQVKDIETGDELKVDNKFILSPKDLCSLPFLEKIIKTGICCLKIEGRNRSPEYVKVVTSVYRRAIDAISEGAFDDLLRDSLLKELKTVYNRDLSPGFYLGIPTSEDHTDAYGSKATKTKIYVGFVKNFYQKVDAAEIKLESSELTVGDNMMIQGPTTGVYEQKVESMQINKETVESAKKGKSVAVKVKRIVRPNDKVFILKE
jgi:U32 family peptidase